jgi:hypothetical protein
MKNLIPEFKSQDELFSFLRKNKSKLIAQKKALPITSDNLEFGYKKFIPAKEVGIKSQRKDDTTDNESEIQVEIIANMSGWCDSQMDVMIKDSWNKSIADVGASGQKLIYHLKNHGGSTDDIIGRDPSLYTKDIDLSVFNFKSDVKKAQALIMSSIICEDYDGKTYNLYEDGQIKQHSIGLQYVQILLCLNSLNEDDATEKKNWDKYYPQVINKEDVDETNYFWAVIEAKIFEVSAVLFGANILTPVLSTSQPSMDTENQPPKSTDLTETKQNKSMIICPSCTTLFVSASDGHINCPGCGQYVSPQSNRAEMSTFDLLSAINETTFITT